MASEVLSGFLRCVLARRRVLGTAMQVYRRVWDEEYETFYYANTRSGETTWTKPKLFLLEEPPVYVEMDANPSARRSPRLNRVKIAADT